MKKTLKLLLVFVLFAPFAADAAVMNVSLAPKNVIQGEPLMITIENIAALSEIKNATFASKKVDAFLYNGKPTILIGIDLNKKPGVYDLFIERTSGETLLQQVVIGSRKKIEAPLGIPKKLGGNTPASQKNLVTTLSKENEKLNLLFTGKKAFWTEKFRFPLASTTVTDEYGYSRQTGEYSIAHKGTDFRAKEGTKIFAMNRGVVRMASKGPVYGNTIVVDHGLGLMTFYMHLSKIYVAEGQLVLPGQVIGLSGQTGYAEMPHLHLSIRLNNTSIDPMKFMEFFQVK